MAVAGLAIQSKGRDSTPRTVFSTVSQLVLASVVWRRLARSGEPHDVDFGCRSIIRFRDDQMGIDVLVGRNSLTRMSPGAGA